MVYSDNRFPIKKTGKIKSGNAEKEFLKNCLEKYKEKVCTAETLTEFYKELDSLIDDIKKRIESLEE
jgi:predicted nuclease with TOPRIM domain